MRNAARHASGTSLLAGIAGWVALLTALICSLVPLGPAHARTIGSAFDPTTTLVVVSPRGPHVRKGERPALRTPLPDDPQQRRFEPATRMAPEAAASLAGPDAAPRCVPADAIAREMPHRLICRAGTIGARAPPRG